MYIIESQYLARSADPAIFEGEYLFTGKPVHSSGVVFP